MENQNLRNLTTGRLHTNMDDICADIEFLTGEKGIMTHQLPRAFEAITPFLKEKLTEERFWNGKYDPLHVGNTIIEPMNTEEKEAFFQRYVKN